MTDETTACRDCNCVSTWRAAFTVAHSFKGSQFVCPSCQEIRSERSGVRTWKLATVILIGVPMLSAGGFSHQYLWIALGWAWLMFSLYISVLPHEWGHALMSRAVGYRPLAIIWGNRHPVVDREVLGVRVLISRAPEGGVTFFEPTNDRRPLLKHAAITAAGPIVNVLLASTAYLAAQSIDATFHESFLKGSLLVFAVANALLALGNLWPSKVNSIAGAIPNDGMKLLSFITRKPIDLAQSRAAACFLRIHFAYREDAQDRVLAEADAAERFVGTKPWIDVARSAALCRLHRPAEARKFLDRVLCSDGGDVGSRALAENNSAWALFMLDERESDAEALERSMRAYGVLPWMEPVMITRACVLAAWAERGSPRLSEARTLLARARGMRPDLLSRMTITVANGLVAAADGDVEGARRELQAARAMGDPGLAGRILEARIPSN